MADNGSCAQEMVQHPPPGLLPLAPPPPPLRLTSEAPFFRGSFFRMTVRVSTMSVNCGRFSGFACQHASIKSVRSCAAQQRLLGQLCAM